MSEQNKDRYPNRPFTRQPRVNSRKETNQSVSSTTSIHVPEVKEINSYEQLAKESENAIESKPTFSYLDKTRQSLIKLVKCQQSDVEAMTLDVQILQSLRTQQKRLSKFMSENNIQKLTDYELPLQALINVLCYTQQLSKQKSPQKSTIRINQQKDINRQLNMVDQYIQTKNFSLIKTPLQNILRKYPNDQLLLEKKKYLTCISSLIQQYEKQNSLFKLLNTTIQKLSNIDVQNVMQANIALKNIKKDVIVTLNKQSKKQDPNERLVNMMSQVDKINTYLLSWVQLLLDKKQIKSKRQLQLEKQCQQRVKNIQLLEQTQNYCRDLLMKSKQELFKQLESIRKNKKKYSEPSYSLILKIYDIFLSQKKQVNDINTYYKAWSQIYTKKNISNENISNEVKKLDERYSENESLLSIKDSIDLLTDSLLERERSMRQSTPLELQLKRLKLQILTLEKQFEQQRKRSKNSNSPSKNGKTKELQEKEEKDIQQALKSLIQLIDSKKWGKVKDMIISTLSKYEKIECFAVRMLRQSFGAQLKMIGQIEIKQVWQQKQNFTIQTKNIQNFQTAINTLMLTLDKQQYDVESYFQNIRNNPNQMNQQHYRLIIRLQRPLLAWKRQQNIQNLKEQYRIVSQDLARQRERSINLEGQLKQSNSSSLKVKKDIEQLLNVIRKIDKGTGQWWKPPKNYKASTFKEIYPLLQIFRQNDLAYQKIQVNEDLLKQELEAITNAIKVIMSCIQGNSWMGEDWGARLYDFKGVTGCDKLISCLKQLTKSASAKLEEERSHYVSAISAYQHEIQSLTNLINDLQREKKSVRLSESSSRKSADSRQKNYRKSSKSKEKGGHVKLAIEEFIQQQKNMLIKIQQLSQQKQILSTNNLAFQNELARSERKIEDFKTDLEQARMEFEKSIITNQLRVRQLEGTIERNEQIKKSLQETIEIQKQSFKEVESELRKQLQILQQREAFYQEQIKQKEIEFRMTIQNNQSHQLKIYQEMYSDIQKELQILKQQTENTQRQNQRLSNLPIQSGDSLSLVKQKQNFQNRQQIQNKYLLEIHNLRQQLDRIQSSKAQEIKRSVENELNYVQIRYKQAQDRLQRQLRQCSDKKIKQWVQKQQIIRQQCEKAFANRLSQSIEEWKRNNLATIIQQQCKLSIQRFIQIDLPQIISQQRSSWEANYHLPAINNILFEEYQKWESAKNHEFMQLTSGFDARIQEILYIQHTEWQRLKAIQISQALQKQKQKYTQQMAIGEANYRKQMQGRKYQEMKALQADFQKRYGERQGELMNELKKYQQRQRGDSIRVKQAADMAINKWRDAQLPRLVEKERSLWRHQFITIQLPNFLKQTRSEWEEQASKRQRNNIGIELRKQKQSWQRQKAQILMQINKKRQSDLKQLHIQKDAQWQVRTKQIQNYWQATIRSQQSNFQILLKQKISQAHINYQQQVIPNVLATQRKKWQLSKESSQIETIKSQNLNLLSQMQSQGNIITNLSSILEEKNKRQQSLQVKIDTLTQQNNEQRQQMIKNAQAIIRLQQLQGIRENQQAEINRLRQQIADKISPQDLKPTQKKHNYIKQFMLQSKNTWFSPEKGSPYQHYPLSQQSNLSYQRQIAILISIIKTKDNEIGFLKKTIDAANAQLRQNHDKLKKQLQVRTNNDKLLAEIKHSYLELEYEVKYLRENEKNLMSKIQIKQQQIKSLYQKTKQENIPIQKNSNSFYQSKYNEMQNMFNLKAKEYRMLHSDAERIKSQNQNLINTIELLVSQKQLLSQQVQELQNQIEHLKESQPQQYGKSSFQRNKLKIKFGYQIMKGHQQSDHTQSLQSRQSKIQNSNALRITRNSTNDLTIKNNQISTKCFISEDKQVAGGTITDFTMLLQKHTYSLVSYLLQQEIIPNMQLYRKFSAQAVNLAKEGKAEMYLHRWQTFMASLFNLTLESRAEEIKMQAEELLKLRDEMTEILERQLQASQGQPSMLIEDYKSLLGQIKSMLQEYLQTGNKEHLRSLCESLAISS